MKIIKKSNYRALAGYSVQGKTLQVSFNDRILDVIWAAYVGELQDIITLKKYNNQDYDQIVFIFRGVVWADPLPLLHLLLLMRRCAQGKIRIKIELYVELDDHNQQRFIKFISKEGVLTRMCGMCHVSMNNKIVSDESIQECQLLEAPLAYEGSSCYPFKVVELSEDIDQIKKYTERVVDRVKSTIVDRVPIWAHDMVMYKLNFFISELLINSFLHAYGQEEKIAGIYIRYRDGLKGKKAEEKKKIGRQISKESVGRYKNPRLDKAYAESRIGFFEVYILDDGCGLNQTLDKDRFIEACHAAFHKGEVSSKVKRKTRRGGLRLINSLFGTERDYIRGVCADEWVGKPLPMKRIAEQFCKSAEGVAHCSFPFVGLGWHGRISWSEPHLSDYNNGWSRLKKNEVNHILDMLSKPVVRMSVFDTIKVEDNRQEGGEPYGNKDFKGLVYFPSKGLTKNDVLASIKKIARENKGAKGTTLIIADIPNNECVTYYEALQRCNLEKNVTDVFCRVVLISQWLSMLVFRSYRNQYSGGFTYSASDTNKFLYSESEKPIESFKSMYGFIRFYDSLQLWIYAQKKYAKSYAYINGDIEWAPGVVIDGYLDFLQTLNSYYITNIYKYSVMRVLGLIGTYKCEFIPLDHLVANFIDVFVKTEFPSYSEKDSGTVRVPIGSVVVTGESKKLVFENSERRQNLDSFSFYLFKHSACKKEVVSLLGWPNEEFLKEKFDELFSYKRVGKTPLISEDGWKSFLIPRYINDKSYYIRSPRETYEDFQKKTPSLIKFGHWCYSYHHDFIHVNLHQAYYYSYITRGKLFKFVLTALARCFNFGYTPLCKLLEVESDGFVEEVYRKCEKLKDTVCVVYPSHPVNNYIVESVSSLLENITDLRFVPISILRRSRSTNIIFTPLVKKRVTSFLKESQNGKIVIFDDGIVSGRTIVELISSLRSCGVEQKNITVLAILERRRLPAIDTSTIAYWRLDTPVMGGNESCPMCAFLKHAEEIKNIFLDNTVQHTISSWLQQWKESSPSQDWVYHGFQAEKIDLKERAEKKFSIVKDKKSEEYVQIGGEDNKIKITTSYGLGLWLTELQSMTNRDDLPLKVISNLDISPTAKIEILSAQLILFNNEFEFGTKYLIVNKLFEVSLSFVESNKHTSLVALILLHSERDLVAKLLKQYFNRKPKLLFINNDMKIVLAYWVKVLKIPFDNYIEPLTRVLKSKKEISSLYSNFHSEIFDTVGDTHPKPISKFIEFQFDEEKGHYYANDALNSLSAILYIILNLNPLSMRPDTTKSFSEHRDAVRNEIKLRAVDLRKLLSLNAISFESSQTVRQKLKFLLEDLREFHRHFFFDIDISSMKKYQSVFNDEVCERVLDMQQNSHPAVVNKSIMVVEDGLFYPDLTKERVFIVYDKYVASLIENIIENVKHVSKKIINPFVGSEPHLPDQKRIASAHSWISVTYEENFLVLKSKNYSESSKNTIYRSMGKRDKWSYLSQFGGKYLVDKDPATNVVTISLYIPYNYSLTGGVQ